MPQVPLYDGPQVQTRPLAFDQASPDAFGAQQGRDMARAGASIAAAGDVLDRINEREIQTQLFDAEAKAKEAYVAWSQEAVKTRQGVGARGLTKEAGDWWGKAAETYGRELSPMAKKMLSRSLAQQSIAAAQSMGNFENSQLEAAQQLSLKANTKASIDSAVTDSSDANLATQRQNILGAWQTQRGKYDEATFNTLVRGELSQMHQAVFNKIFVESPTRAKLYYEVNQKEIDGAVKDNILTRLKAGVADEQGGSAAREEFARATAGRGYNDAIPVDEIDRALVKRFEGEPDALKAARAELDRQVALRNKTQVEMNAGGIEAVYALHNQGTGIAAIKRTPQWAALPAKTQDAITYEWDQRARAARSQNLQDRVLVEQELQLKYAPQMLEWSQPEALAKMTRAEIMARAPEIGMRNTEELLRTWQGFQTNQVKLADAKIDNDLFNSVLAGAGVNPKPPTGDREGAQRVLELRAQVKSALGKMQTGTKRELLEEEKTKVMQDIVNARVLTRGWWGNDYSNTTPVRELKAGELNAAAVNVTGRDGKAQVLPLASIPTADYAEVERYLTDRGITPTPQAVAQRWYQLKGKK